MKWLTRQGYLIEEEGMRYLGEIDADRALTPLPATRATRRALQTERRAALETKLRPRVHSQRRHGSTNVRYWGTRIARSNFRSWRELRPPRQVTSTSAVVS